VRHLRVGGENDEPAAEMGEMRWAEVRRSQWLRVGGRGADHAIQAKSRSRCNVGPPMKLTMARQAAEKWWRSTCRHVTCRDASRTRLGPRPEGREAVRVPPNQPARARASSAAAARPSRPPTLPTRCARSRSPSGSRATEAARGRARAGRSWPPVRRPLHVRDGARTRASESEPSCATIRSRESTSGTA